MNIISGLYNKMMTFFQNDKEESSRSIASNRLKLVLLHDRTKLDNQTLESMRQELIDVISRYIEIDQEALGLNLEGEGEAIALMLNIPVIRPKTQEEIELARTEAEEKLKAKYKEELEQERESTEAEEDVTGEDSTENTEVHTEEEAVAPEELLREDKGTTVSEAEIKSEQDDEILEEIAIVEDSANNIKKDIKQKG